MKVLGDIDRAERDLEGLRHQRRDDISTGDPLRCTQAKKYDKETDFTREDTVEGRL